MAVIENNTMIDCEHSLSMGAGSGEGAPHSVHFAGNIKSRNI